VQDLGHAVNTVVGKLGVQLIRRQLANSTLGVCWWGYQRVAHAGGRPTLGQVAFQRVSFTLHDEIVKDPTARWRPARLGQPAQITLRLPRPVGVAGLEPLQLVAQFGCLAIGEIVLCTSLRYLRFQPYMRSSIEEMSVHC
jgi:hypothetical protein